jgi:hypothetical protein
LKALSPADETTDQSLRQNRPGSERSQAQRWGEIAAHDATEIMQALDEALALLNDPQVRYQQASEEVRRLINQALFEKLYIRDDDINDAELVLGPRHPPSRQCYPRTRK